jgi:hypothetical protein
MGAAIVLFVIVFGFALPFVLNDSGSRPSDRLADGFGVPRQWFAADIMNRYARFGRSLRSLGLGIGGLLGWGIARALPAADSFAKFGSGMSRATRQDIRGYVSSIAGALFGMAVATFLAERRSPALVVAPIEGIEEQPRTNSRTWGAVLGPALLVMLIAPTRSGSVPHTLVYPLAFSFVGVILGFRVARHTTKERTVDHPFAALYPRSIRDYVPYKLGLGWIASVVVFCSVVFWNGTRYHLNDPTQWFSSPAEYWITGGLVLFGGLCCVAASIGVVRSSVTLDTNDPRALIIDDARRACAVQRLAGASMMLLMFAIHRFSPNGRLGVLTLPSTILCFWGAVVWCGPAGIPIQTAKRWKSLFAVNLEGKRSQQSLAAVESLDEVRGNI